MRRESTHKCIQTCEQCRIVHVHNQVHHLDELVDRNEEFEPIPSRANRILDRFIHRPDTLWSSPHATPFVLHEILVRPTTSSTASTLGLSIIDLPSYYHLLSGMEVLRRRDARRGKDLGRILGSVICSRWTVSMNLLEQDGG